MSADFSKAKMFGKGVASAIIGGGLTLMITAYAAWDQTGTVDPEAVNLVERVVSTAFNVDHGAIVGIVAGIFGVMKCLKNYSKNHPDAFLALKMWFGDTTGRLSQILLVGVVAAGMFGCNTVAGAGGSIKSDYYNKTTQKEGGVYEDETRYIATSKAGLMGDIDSSTHQMFQRYGGDGPGVNAVGSNAQGISNEGNQVMVRFAEKFADALVKGLMSALGAAMGGEPTPTLPEVEAER